MVNMPQSSWWETTREKLSHAVKTQNIEEFKNWNVVRGIPLYSSLDDQWEKQGENIIRLLPEVYPYWKEILTLGESKKGHTEKSFKEVQRKIHFPEIGEISITPWWIQACHHGIRYEHATKKLIWDYDVVIEIGAGIGELARLIRTVAGKYLENYYVYDFPETFEISNWYNDGQLKLVSDMENIREKVKSKKTLLVATWSLSEIPPSERKKLLDPLIKAKRIDSLIAFQTNVWGYDNLDYFVWDFPSDLDTFVRLEPHIKGYHYSQGTNIYCFGLDKV